MLGAFGFSTYPSWHVISYITFVHFTWCKEESNNNHQQPNITLISSIRTYLHLPNFQDPSLSRVTPKDLPYEKRAFASCDVDRVPWRKKTPGWVDRENFHKKSWNIWYFSSIFGDFRNFSCRVAVSSIHEKLYLLQTGHLNSLVGTALLTDLK